jgi:hypothetical protein
MNRIRSLNRLFLAWGKLLPGDIIHDEAPRISTHKTMIGAIDAANAKRARKMERNRRRQAGGE